MNGTGPFVTRLTPVYNCGGYIESVLSQTFKNYEYVIVHFVRFLTGQQWP